MLPTADNAAQAIIAACRETGEDPILCAQRAMGIRARHYAMHALLQVFPTLKRAAAARMVGCVGGPVSFCNNSLYQVIRIIAVGSNAGKRAASWWDEAAFGRVIEAIECPVPRQPEHPEPPPVPTPSAPGAPALQGRASPGGEDQPPGQATRRASRHPRTRRIPSGAGTYAKVLEDDADDDGPIFDQGKFAGDRRGLVRPIAQSKRQMADELAEAVRNTAKIPVPDE